MKDVDLPAAMTAGWVALNQSRREVRRVGHFKILKFRGDGVEETELVKDVGGCGRSIRSCGYPIRFPLDIANKELNFFKKLNRVY